MPDDRTWLEAVTAGYAAKTPQANVVRILKHLAVGSEEIFSEVCPEIVGNLVPAL